MQHQNEESNEERLHDENKGMQAFQMKLINIQGLSQHKVNEIEDLVTDNSLLCLTETQQTLDKTKWTKDLNMYASMRGKNERKGGGLMLLFKDQENVHLQKVKTQLQDILVVKGTLKKDKVTIIIVYFSVVRGEEERKINSGIKKEVKKHIEECEDDELIFLLGDFNSHIGILGEQQINYNGKLVMDMKMECNLILLNATDKCEGMITWSRGEQRSAIDFVIVNNNALNLCDSMKIDEQQDIFDLSDHNLIEVNLNLHNTHHNFDRNSEWKETVYYKLDENSIEEYIRELEELITNTNDLSIDTFNNMIDEAATKTLKRSYKRRVSNDKVKREEPPWITAEIRSEIKKRKRLNRSKRNCNLKEKEEAAKQYADQKKVVQSLVYEAIQNHEKKTTSDIKTNRDNRKKLWDNINRLRGKTKKKLEECKLYNVNGEKLEKLDAEEEIKDYWTKIYKKHDNTIEEVWNEETRKEYNLLIGREYHEKEITYKEHTFPASLQEHYDMMIPIKKKITPMAYPAIKVEELKAHLKKIKRNKATGPDNIKGELYIALEKSDICTRKLNEILQNILDHEIKVKSWEKSNTRMIPKVKKPMATQLRPIALMDVSYKLYMKIQGKKIDDHLKCNNEQLDTQAGFTSGCRIEDNLFVLQYCIEESFKKKKSLIVTSIDYSKAFDSIKRDTIITTLMHYRITPKS